MKSGNFSFYIPQYIQPYAFQRGNSRQPIMDEKYLAVKYIVTFEVSEN